MENQRRKPTDSNPITEFYFDQILVETRYIDAVVPDTSVELFGRKFSTPVMTAALSHIKGKDGDGMVQMAQGASEAGALTWVGMTSLEQYGEIAKTGAPLVRIIKPYADKEEIFSRIEQAEKLGAVAVGMDIDHSFNGQGQPDNLLGKPHASPDLGGDCLLLQTDQAALPDQRGTQRPGRSKMPGRRRRRHSGLPPPRNHGLPRCRL